MRLERSFGGTALYVEPNCFVHVAKPGMSHLLAPQTKQPQRPGLGIEKADDAIVLSFSTTSRAPQQG
jgi:hypothetical protein